MTACALTKRCVCERPEVEDDVLPDTLVCKLCSGWFAVSIDSIEALDRFRERFGVSDDNDSGR